MKVLYAGDDSLQVLTMLKGVESLSVFAELEDGNKYMQQALEKGSEISVTHMPGHRAIAEFPKSVEELKKYDMLILSDLSRDTLLAHFYPGSIPGPNRLKVIKKYVEEGGGLAYCGGWMMFQGYCGKGGWHGTPVSKVLPVEILPIFDDRVDEPEGIKSSIVESNHPIMKEIPWDTCPPFYGYNRTGKLKEGASLLAKINDDNFIAAWGYGDGRVMVFTSDPAPNWGLSFIEWENYSKFWIQVAEWLVKIR